MRQIVFCFSDNCIRISSGTINARILVVESQHVKGQLRTFQK